MPFKTCEALNCPNTNRVNREVSYFRFPVNSPDKLKKWMQNIVMKNSKRKLKYLCSAHFSTTECKDTHQRRRCSSVPTIQNSVRDTQSCMSSDAKYSSKGSLPNSKKVVNTFISCAAEGCTSNNKNSNLQFHLFPKNNNERSGKCNDRQVLGSKSDERYLCQKHFREEVLSDTFKKQLTCFSILSNKKSADTHRKSYERCQCVGTCLCKQSTQKQLTSNGIDVISSDASSIRPCSTLSSELSTCSDLRNTPPVPIPKELENDCTQRRRRKHVPEEPSEIVKLLILDQIEHSNIAAEIDTKLSNAIQNINQFQKASTELSKKMNGIFEKISTSFEVNFNVNSN